MSKRLWWIAAAALALVGLVGFILPGLITENPTFFLYGGITLLIAVVVAVSALTIRSGKGSASKE